MVAFTVQWLSGLTRASEATSEHHCVRITVLELGGGVIPQLTLSLATMHVANISQVTMSMSKEVKIHVRVSAIVAGSRSFRVIATALNGR